MRVHTYGSRLDAAPSMAAGGGGEGCALLPMGWAGDKKSFERSQRGRGWVG
jgi:hypothetical protein